MVFIPQNIAIDTSGRVLISPSGAPWTGCCCDPCLCSAGEAVPSSFDAAGGTGHVDVSVVKGCPVTPSADVAWITASVFTPTVMPLGLGQYAICTVGDIAYIAGGYWDDGNIGGDTTDRVWKYDMSSDTWTELASMPDIRRYGTLVSDGTYLYFMGGYRGIGGDNKSYANNWRYNIGTDTWDVLAPLPQERGQHNAVINGDFIWLMAGFTSPGVGNNISDALWCYQISTDTWTTNYHKMCYPSFDGSAVYKDGFIYYFGGLINPGAYFPTDQACRYEIATDQWLPIATMPVVNAKPAYVLIGDTVYFMGGFDAGLLPCDASFSYYIPDDTYSTDCCSMTVNKNDSGAAADSSGNIFVFGGSVWDGSIHLGVDTVEYFSDTMEVDFTVAANAGDPRTGNILVDCYDGGAPVQRQIEISQGGIT